jgi:RIO kinase 1
LKQSIQTKTNTYPLEDKKLKVTDYENGDLEASFERRKRKPPKKSRAHHSAKELYLEDKDKQTSESKFAHPDLQELHLRGYVDEILSELKSGKEATVYLGENHLSGERTLVAVKVYKDLEARSFKNDSVYRQGRFVGNDRTIKAISQRSKAGLIAQQSMWVMYEYAQLWQLYNAGIPVPRPLVGPETKEMEASGRVVLMQWIGSEDAPAPRLSDVKLSGSKADDAFEQSVTLLKKMLELDKVHGDFSTYNLLYWQEKVIVIDVPQMVNVKENKHAGELLERDVRSLCTSFKKHGIYVDPVAVLRQLPKI